MNEVEVRERRLNGAGKVRVRPAKGVKMADDAIFGEMNDSECGRFIGRAKVIPIPGRVGQFSLECGGLQGGERESLETSANRTVDVAEEQMANLGRITQSSDQGVTVCQTFTILHRQMQFCGMMVTEHHHRSIWVVA